mgnify:CR=1 FL=1
MNILGISFLEDASACVLKDGTLVSAISEERINRVKLWRGIPTNAIEQALRLAGLTMKDIDLIATHGHAPEGPNQTAFDEKRASIENSNLKSDVKKLQLESLETRLKHEQQVLAVRTPEYLKQVKALGKKTLVYAHHESHAASAFYGSGWENCFVLTADGWGEDGSSTVWKGSNSKISLLHQSDTIDSLGFFYGSITKALGFIPHRHEGKVLGLAAYCKEPKSYDWVRQMIDYDSTRKKFTSRMDRGVYIPHFNNPHLSNLVKSYSREDVSAAAQRTLEEVVCAYVKDLAKTPIKVALAGGIFANVKLNQRLRELKNVEDVYVFPNMGDGGLSVGAAYLAYVETTGKKPQALDTALLGTADPNEAIESDIKKSGLKYQRLDEIESKVGELLAQKQVVAVCDGRMEYGPRALGNRSILFHAADHSVNQWLNQKLKRSEFMPFAPATLEEKAHEHYIDLKLASQPARYMTMTYDCTDKMRKESPAAVHIDGTARPQIVGKSTYPHFHAILSEYFKQTGFSTVVNTSFNMHEEPIVCSSHDAIRAAVAGELPYLALGNFLVKIG